MTAVRRLAVVPTLKPFPKDPDCPKCGRRSWGITWHPRGRALCMGPIIEEAHLHWSCACSFTDITGIKREGEME